ncbi:transporter [Kozakia baliensis]|nr:transporter [Kozakia baliensis]
MNMSGPTGGEVASKQLITNAFWNIAGRIAPVFVAIVTTPRLIHLLGLSRWGIFTIVLSLIGTFGIFDLGLGRALSRAVATKGAEERMDQETCDLVLTGVSVLTGVGVVAALVSAACCNLWVDHGLKIPVELHREVLLSFFVFCATAPLVMINAAIWGVLTGRQAYRETNLINIPISVMYYLGPLLMLYVWDSLIGVMFVLAGCRLWMTIAYIRFVYRLIPELKHAQLRPRLLKPLMQYGGWLTVSNIIYPLLGYLDRFIISNLIPVARIGFYTTPSDAVSRFNMFTGSVNASAFTAISASYARNVTRTCELYKTSVVAVSFILLPLCLGASLFSYDILALWIDRGFSEQSGLVMKILCIGVFISGVDSITATFLEGIGRPDIGTKISIGELVIYLPVLYWGVSRYGVVGASAIWTLRFGFDYIVRAVMCLRIYPALRGSFLRGAVTVMTGVAGMCFSIARMNFWANVEAGVILLAITYIVMWFYTLDAFERQSFLQTASRIKSRLYRRETT